MNSILKRVRGRDGKVSLSNLLDTLESRSLKGRRLPRVVAKLSKHAEIVDDLDVDAAAPEKSPIVTQGRDARSSLSLYFRELSRIPLLTREDEVFLAKRIEESHVGIRRICRTCKISPGVMRKMVTLPTRPQRRAFLVSRKIRSKRSERILDELDRLERMYARAKEKMVLSNLRLVISVAKRYQNLGMPLADLINEGNLGLLKAVDKYNYKLGFRFSTYATWYIRQAISRALTDKSRTIRLPAHIAEFMSRFIRTKMRLAHQIGREPTAREIANVLKLPVKRVIELMQVSQDTASLDMPIGREKDTLLLEILEEEGPDTYFRELNISFLYDELKKMLETLSPREQTIIKLRFGLEGVQPKTLHEIGSQLNLTRERIRQIEERTLDKLKKLCIRRNVYDFLSEVE
ncbi:sigma-70 family RNA polymerase sigma factor [bacterium]|nr:sigma-70 family RNA polymerase sigma factor [bacterium]